MPPLKMNPSSATAGCIGRLALWECQVCVELVLICDEHLVKTNMFYLFGLILKRWTWKLGYGMDSVKADWRKVAIYILTALITMWL